MWSLTYQLSIKISQLKKQLYNDGVKWKPYFSLS